MPPPALSTNRIAWVDGLRGYAMILIVLSHCLLGLNAAKLLPLDGLPSATLLFLYFCHMPIIFFVSGYVSKDAQRPTNVFARSLMRWVVLPYILWSAILVLVQTCAPGANQQRAADNLLTILWTPISLYWFLYALFFIKIADYLTARLWHKPLVVYLALLAVAVGGFSFCTQNEWHGHTIQKIFMGLFFYNLGRIGHEYAATLETFVVHLSTRKIQAALIAALCGCLLAGATYYYASQPPGSIAPLYQFQSGVLVAGLVSIPFWLIIERYTPRGIIARNVQIMGIYSMAVYVQHTMWGGGVRTVLRHMNLTDPLLLTIGIILVSSLLSVMFQKLTDRMGLSPFLGIRPNNAP